MRQDFAKLMSYRTMNLKPNAFFQQVYQRDYRKEKLLLAADHTGQLGYEDKKDREDRFRAEGAKWTDEEVRRRNTRSAALGC